MDTTVIVIVVVAIALVVAFAAWQMSQKKKSGQLKERFGPEYDRAVSESERRSEAEKELDDRATRVEKLHIKDLDPTEKARFGGEWQTVQARFVDDPGDAIKQADELVQRVMEARGYPITDFEQQAADISVDHPEVVTNYRSAHEIAAAHEREGVATEQLRQAMIHYRALFSDLLGSPTVRS